jgi:nucleotide-binding universal stress UspA family protein
MLFKRILVAVDDAQPALRATDAAIRLARQLGATIAFVNVIPISVMPANEMGFIAPQQIEERQKYAQALLGLVRDRAGDVPSDQIVREGVVAAEIVAAANEWRADLIVVGNHARPLLEKLLLSNTTKGVLHRAPCPVLVVSAPVRTPSRPVEHAAAMTTTT